MDIQEKITQILDIFESVRWGEVPNDKEEMGKFTDDILFAVRQEVSKAIPKEKDVMYSGLDVYKHQQVVCLDKVSDWGKKVGYNQALSDIQSALKKKGLI